MEQVINSSSFGKHPVTGQQFLEIDAAFIKTVTDNEQNQYKFVFRTDNKILLMIEKIPNGLSVTIDYETGKYF